MTYLVCACLLIIFVVPSVLPLILGHSFTSAVTGVQIMVACIIPMLFLRISSLRLTATGNFRLNSLIAAGRCVLLIILLHILPFMLTNLKGASMAALCWLMAETTAVLVTQHKILAIRKSI
jgi:O-antigen/teichoic acid export membrane protein